MRVLPHAIVISNDLALSLHKSDSTTCTRAREKREKEIQYRYYEETEIVLLRYQRNAGSKNETSLEDVTRI